MLVCFYSCFQLCWFCFSTPPLCIRNLHRYRNSIFLDCSNPEKLTRGQWEAWKSWFWRILWKPCFVSHLDPSVVSDVFPLKNQKNCKSTSFIFFCKSGSHMMSYRMHIYIETFSTRVKSPYFWPATSSTGFPFMVKLLYWLIRHCDICWNLWVENAFESLQMIVQLNSAIVSGSHQSSPRLPSESKSLPVVSKPWVISWPIIDPIAP